MLAGILDPRTLGYMNGASVSMSNRSRGMSPFSRIDRTPSSDLSFHRKPIQKKINNPINPSARFPFTRVYRPVSPMYSPISKYFNAWAVVPVKQWSTAGGIRSLNFSKILTISSWASRSCRNNGLPTSQANWTCFSNTSICTSWGEKLRLKSKPHSPTGEYRGRKINIYSIFRRIHTYSYTFWVTSQFLYDLIAVICPSFGIMRVHTCT